MLPQASPGCPGPSRRPWSGTEAGSTLLSLSTGPLSPYLTEPVWEGVAELSKSLPTEQVQGQNGTVVDPCCPWRKSSSSLSFKQHILPEDFICARLHARSWDEQ